MSWMSSAWTLLPRASKILRSSGQYKTWFLLERVRSCADLNKDQGWCSKQNVWVDRFVFLILYLEDWRIKISAEMNINSMIWFLGTGAYENPKRF